MARVGVRGWGEGGARGLGSLGGAAPRGDNQVTHLCRLRGAAPTVEAVGLYAGHLVANKLLGRAADGAPHLCGKQGGSDFGQLALRRPLSAPDRAPGCPELRPASAKQPLGPRWPRRYGHCSPHGAPRRGRWRSRGPPAQAFAAVAVEACSEAALLVRA
eukprot:scaffold4849_cov58-Phaeocystis_antarctica.AAC.7